MDSSLTAKKLTGHSGIISSIATRGDLFVTGANRHQGAEGKVRIWRFPEGEPVGEIGTDLNSIFGLALSPDSRLLVVGGGGAVFDQKWEYTGGVEVWSLEDKRRVMRFGEEELFFVTSIDFSPDGKVLLTSSSPLPSRRPPHHYEHIRLWQTSDFEKISAFAEEGTNVARACFSPQGRFVALAVNPPSFGVRASFGLLAAPRQKGFLSSLPGKSKVKVRLHDVSSMTPLIRFWNTVSQHEEPGLELGKGRVRGLAFSPDGCTLASCGSRLTTWDFESREVIMEFPQGSSSSCVTFSPDGTILASGGGYRAQPGSPYEDCGVKLWNSKTARLITFLPHEKPVYSLSFSPDGQRIVAGGELGELLLWCVGPQKL